MFSCSVGIFLCSRDAVYFDKAVWPVGWKTSPKRHTETTLFDRGRCCWVSKLLFSFSLVSKQLLLSQSQNWWPEASFFVQKSFCVSSFHKWSPSWWVFMKTSLVQYLMECQLWVAAAVRAPILQDGLSGDTWTENPLLVSYCSLGGISTSRTPSTLWWWLPLVLENTWIVYVEYDFIAFVCLVSSHNIQYATISLWWILKANSLRSLFFFCFFYMESTTKWLENYCISCSQIKAY